MTSKHKFKAKTLLVPGKRNESRFQIAHFSNSVQEFEADRYAIPSIINGIVMKPKSRFNLEPSCPFKNEINQHINELTDDISNHNKSDKLYDSPHKTVLIGDSHLKGFSSELKSMLKKGYELISIVKPGANSNILRESFQETVKQLSQKDLLVLGCGTNDLELDNFGLLFQNMRNYLSTVSHTNILLLGLPFRYNLSNSSIVNSKILLINKKLQKLTNAFPYTRFLETHNDNKLFTNHGLHRNRLGKKLTSTQIASCVLPIFKNEMQFPNP